MASNDPRLILASGSPRRRELLERFGVPFDVIPARGEESPPPGLGPGETVMATARAKAEEVLRRTGDEDAVLIAADTLVELDGKVLGKPGTAERAREMLAALSGREHRVWSGVCVARGGELLCRCESTRVFFRELSAEEIRAYADTGEPLDKAGAYGYQGLAGLFVERSEGDYFTVVGLPLCLLGQMLGSFGISLL